VPDDDDVGALVAGVAVALVAAFNVGGSFMGASGRVGVVLLLLLLLLLLLVSTVIAMISLLWGF
jgi:hypothetical protein